MLCSGYNVIVLRRSKALCCFGFGAVVMSKVAVVEPRPFRRHEFRTIEARWRSRVLKLVSGASVLQLLGAHFSKSGLRTLGRCHRVAACLGILIFVRKKHWSPRLKHVPFNVVGQHTQEDVCPDSVFETVANRPHLEVHGLE